MKGLQGIIKPMSISMRGIFVEPLYRNSHLSYELNLKLCTYTKSDQLRPISFQQHAIRQLIHFIISFISSTLLISNLFKCPHFPLIKQLKDLSVNQLLSTLYSTHRDEGFRVLSSQPQLAFQLLNHLPDFQLHQFSFTQSNCVQMQELALSQIFDSTETQLIIGLVIRTIPRSKIFRLGHFLCDIEQIPSAVMLLSTSSSDIYSVPQITIFPISTTPVISFLHLRLSYLLCQACFTQTNRSYL